MYGLDFEHPNFEPITLNDLDGIPHEFHFRTQIIGIWISLEGLTIKNASPAGYQLQQICDGGIVRGKIGRDDESDGRVPRLMIDGKQVSREEFGRMLRTHEGWNFKMEIFDRSEMRRWRKLTKRHVPVDSALLTEQYLSLKDQFDGFNEISDESRLPPWRFFSAASLSRNT